MPDSPSVPQPLPTTLVSKMDDKALRRFLNRAAKAAERDRLEPCEHGHPECSDTPDGPCWDEAFACPAGPRRQESSEAEGRRRS